MFNYPIPETSIFIELKGGDRFINYRLLIMNIYGLFCGTRLLQLDTGAFLIGPKK